MSYYELSFIDHAGFVRTINSDYEVETPAIFKSSIGNILIDSYDSDIDDTIYHLEILRDLAAHRQKINKTISKNPDFDFRYRTESGQSVIIGAGEHHQRIINRVTSSYSKFIRQIEHIIKDFKKRRHIREEILYGRKVFENVMEEKIVDFFMEGF